MRYSLFALATPAGVVCCPPRPIVELWDGPMLLELAGTLPDALFVG